MPFIGDALEGKNIKESIKTQSKQAGESYAQKLLDDTKRRRRRTVEDEISAEKRQKKIKKIKEGASFPKRGGRKRNIRKDIFSR